MMVITPVPIKAHRLPQRSVSQGVTKQAAKQPAWRVEATGGGVSRGRVCEDKDKVDLLTVLRHVGFGFGIVVNVTELPMKRARQPGIRGPAFADLLLLHCWHSQNTSNGSDTVVALAEMSNATEAAV